MKRSLLLTVVVLAVSATAVGLRLRSHYAQQRAMPTPTEPEPHQPLSSPALWDYVAHPLVSPDEIDRGPKRIVSLAPSITEIVCALGLGDRLVGRTQFCRYPPGVDSVTVVGALMDTDFEKIKSLRPDLVLTTSNSGPVIDSLRRLDLPYAAVPHEKLEQVYTAVERIGALCGRPTTAAALSLAIRRDIRYLAETARALDVPSQKVLVTYDPLPIPPAAIWVAGPGSFLDDLVRLAGHTNAAADVADAPDIELPLEKLLALDVDVILTLGDPPSLEQSAETYRQWDRLSTLRAIRDRRVRYVGKEWLSAGPRIALALRDFIAALSESP